MSDPGRGAAAPDGTPDDPSDSTADGAAGLSRKDVFSWMGGPRAAVETSGIELGYRGQRLGFPEAGPGSVATFNRRTVAILIDWIASLLVARTIEAQFLDQTTVTRRSCPRSCSSSRSRSSRPSGARPSGSGSVLRSAPR